MAQTLGTLASGSTTAGTQLYFVSLDKRLATGELSNGTPTATTTVTGITLSEVAVNTAVLSSVDGTIVAPIGRAIQFRVTTGKDVNAATTVPIVIHYFTDDSNEDYLEVDLTISTTVKVS